MDDSATGLPTDTRRSAGERLCWQRNVRRTVAGAAVHDSFVLQLYDKAMDHLYFIVRDRYLVQRLEGGTNNAGDGKYNQLLDSIC